MRDRAMNHRFPQFRPSDPGLIDALGAEQQAAITMLRSWSRGIEGQQAVWSALCGALGAPRARNTLRAFETALGLIRKHGRIPMRLRPVGCDVISGDEQLFAQVIGGAISQDREAALTAAMLLVRPDLSPELTRAAEQLALHLRCAGAGCALFEAVHGHPSRPARLN